VASTLVANSEVGLAVGVWLVAWFLAILVKKHHPQAGAGALVATHDCATMVLFGCR
jgi:hypothetical protein